MALEPDLETISVHKPTGSWVCEHAGGIHAVSFAIPVEQEIGWKISDPRKAGIHYLFVLAPNNPDTKWKENADKTKFALFELNKINNKKAARNVSVFLQQNPLKPILPTPAPKKAYTEDPAVKVTKTFDRMTIDVTVSGKPLPQQTFAYPALFRIDAPTIGKPSLKLLWGRYDPENPLFNHVFRTKSRDDNSVAKEPFSILTEMGKRDKFARKFHDNFKLVRNTWKAFSKDEYTEKFVEDRALFREVIQANYMKIYQKLADTYQTTLRATGQKVAGKDFFRQTFLHFISEQLE